MHPELRVVVGGVQVVLSTHALAVLGGVAAGAWLTAWRAREPGAALLAAAVVTVAALAGAHALFRALHGGPVALWTGGLASTGGVAAGLGAAWTVARLLGRPAGAVLDALAPGGLLALAIGRVGCFLGGCCYGGASALPWAAVFPDLGPPARHPLQLYSAVGDLLVLALLPAHAPRPGAVARRAGLAFGLLRAGLECLRDPATTDRLPGGWLTLPQAAALALAAAALLAPRLRARGPSTIPPARRIPAHGG